MSPRTWFDTTGSVHRPPVLGALLTGRISGQDSNGVSEGSERGGEDSQIEKGPECRGIGTGKGTGRENGQGPGDTKQVSELGRKGNQTGTLRDPFAEIRSRSANYRDPEVVGLNTKTDTDTERRVTSQSRGGRGKSQSPSTVRTVPSVRLFGGSK